MIDILDRTMQQENPSLPLAGIRVVEFTHMVMGPTCGMILADLGAEVIKVEPPGGDKTRNLPGLGIGFFRAFNRNKKSVVLDITTEEGRAAAAELAGQSDVLLENFRPGLMEKLGLDYATLSARYPHLIYVSHKGFLPGPYEKRLALDEVVQMMGGLSYMTGPKGRPLRAGTSVNDIMGGMFGAIGVLAALRERDRTGRGQEIQSALFENCVFRWRQDPQSARAGHRLFPRLQPQQEERGAGHHDRRRARGRRRTGRAERCVAGKLPARPDGKARSRLRNVVGKVPAPDLRFPQGLPARTVRKTPGAR
ncbi:CaiB/BaiF family protein [Cupriavidus sp. U2]|nr:CaiB/BaiF family protein [Cupriavidus sp. U2]